MPKRIQVILLVLLDTGPKLQQKPNTQYSTIKFSVSAVGPFDSPVCRFLVF